ncbi:MAG: hypothetical protein JWN87_1650 [Frankiales bacterium]|nr:hypothetical protein [Frankiales bacterium]MCW2586236.1 hypothetical protein [Frankiales bacterium]
MSPKRLLARAAVAIIVAAALPQTAALAVPEKAQCTKGLGVGLVDTSGSERDPRASVYVVANAKPGSTFTRRFQVCNGTGGPLTVKLYGGDATIAGGAFSVSEGRTRGDVAQWTTVDPGTVTLPDQTRVIATATFTVPAQATAGERYGVLLAELPAQRSSSGLGVASRVGVRVYLNVGEGGAPKSDFAVSSLQAVRRADGTPAVLARVTNTGRRALDLRGTLLLSHGPGGLSAGPFDAQVGTTLKPGDSAPVTVPLDKAIRGGPWRAVIALKSGLLERQATGNLTFPDQAASEAAPVTASPVPLYQDESAVTLFAAVLIGIMALFLLLFALLAFLRRREREDPRSALPATG